MTRDAQPGFAALAARSFDEPLGADERATLQVWGDALEAAGDPRGPLISMELGQGVQRPTRALRRAMLEYVVTQGRGLLGELAPLALYKRAVELDWRSGLLYGAFLDTRYVGPHAQLTPVQLVHQLLAAPAAATLRRLHVRVGSEEKAMAVLAALDGVKRPPPLEQLLVLSEKRPHWMSRQTPLARYPEIARTYPDLHLFAASYLFVELPVAPEVMIAQLDPRILEDRVALGRALMRIAEPSWAPTLARLAALGPRAFMFLETLMMLLAPGLIKPQAAVVECLAALGPAAGGALPLLARITGRTEHYDLATRRAAGRAIAALQR